MYKNNLKKTVSLNKIETYFLFKFEILFFNVFHVIYDFINIKKHKKFLTNFRIT